MSKDYKPDSVSKCEHSECHGSGMRKIKTRRMMRSKESNVRSQEVRNNVVTRARRAQEQESWLHDSPVQGQGKHRNRRDTFCCSPETTVSNRCVDDIENMPI